jgi:hypothetical protein
MVGQMICCICGVGYSPSVGYRKKGECTKAKAAPITSALTMARTIRALIAPLNKNLMVVDYKGLGYEY